MKTGRLFCLFHEFLGAMGASGVVTSLSASFSLLSSLSRISASMLRKGCMFCLDLRARSIEGELRHSLMISRPFNTFAFSLPSAPIPKPPSELDTFNPLSLSIAVSKPNGLLVRAGSLKLPVCGPACVLLEFFDATGKVSCCCILCTAQTISTFLRSFPPPQYVALHQASDACLHQTGPKPLNPDVSASSEKLSWSSLGAPFSYFQAQHLQLEHSAILNRKLATLPVSSAAYEIAPAE
mmetsp:Transcript_41214/g.64404  ORF Transcript_41214/g.64404 Transcript_41214/m.64404 type:complete len:238 (+) Transcript_41214:219-932(+)